MPVAAAVAAAVARAAEAPDVSPRVRRRIRRRPVPRRRRGARAARRTAAPRRTGSGRLLRILEAQVGDHDANAPASARGEPEAQPVGAHVVEPVRGALGVRREQVHLDGERLPRRAACERRSARHRQRQQQRQPWGEVSHARTESNPHAAGGTGKGAPPGVAHAARSTNRSRDAGRARRGLPPRGSAGRGGFGLPDARELVAQRALGDPEPGRRARLVAALALQRLGDRRALERRDALGEGPRPAQGSRISPAAVEPAAAPSAAPRTFGGRSCVVTDSPRASTSERCTTFSSSRTLPG